MKNVIILLSVFLFLFVAGVGHAGKSKPTPADGDIIIYYNKMGEIVDIMPAPGKDKKCSKIEGKENVYKKLIELLNEGYEIEAIGKDLFKLYKNPSCIIYVGGWPICICCQ